MSAESSSDSKPSLIPLNLHPPTPLGDQQSVEFPCIGSLDQSIVHDPQAPSNASPASNTTSSSKLTSSDKLTALRESTPQGSPAPNWSTRSPNHLPGIARGFRRSLDASVSLPSFVTGTGEIESPVLNHTWNTTNNLLSNLHSIGTISHVNSPDHSPGKETPKQRVSFESDRASLPTMQSVKHAFTRGSRTSDPAVPSPALRSSAYTGHRSQKDHDSPFNSQPESPSQSRSRAASPLRLFHQWSAGLHRSQRHAAEDPFVPIDPFQLKTQLRLPCCFCLPYAHHHDHVTDPEHGGSSCSSQQCNCEDVIPVATIKSFLATANLFLTDTMPRQIYLILLFRLPAMYFSRVARIFEDAEVSKPDIQRMINTGGGGGLYMDPSASRQATRANTPRPSENMSLGAAAGIGLTAHIGAAPASVSHLPLPFPEDWTAPLVSPALIRFKHSWEVFIDSLLREWKTLNVVSALLLSAILTTFQIPDAADDPLTRTAALLSLICALMSLCYGCMYIVRFGTMRSMYRASRWAEEARKTDTLIWWNVWVMLAMPAVWLAWSMVLFVVSILSFVWRTGSASDPSHDPLGGHAALGPRIAITGVFALGMVYFFMIVRTLKRYGVHVGGRGITSVGQGVRAAHNMNGPDAMTAALEMRGRPRERSTEGGRRRDGERNGTARRNDAQRLKELEATKGLGLSLGGDMGGSPRSDSGIAIALDKGEH